MDIQRLGYDQCPRMIALLKAGASLGHHVKGDAWGPEGLVLELLGMREHGWDQPVLALGFSKALILASMGCSPLRSPDLYPFHRFRLHSWLPLTPSTANEAHVHLPMAQ